MTILPLGTPMRFSKDDLWAEGPQTFLSKVLVCTLLVRDTKSVTEYTTPIFLLILVTHENILNYRP